MTKIQQGYINVVLSYNWMSKKTKEFLKDKISSIKTHIVEPNWLREDPTKLEKFYEKVKKALQLTKSKLFER